LDVAVFTAYDFWFASPFTSTERLMKLTVSTMMAFTLFTNWNDSSWRDQNDRLDVSREILRLKSTSLN
jgi:hypothetical protein